jgi:Amidohydrolase family
MCLGEFTLLFAATCLSLAIAGCSGARDPQSQRIAIAHVSVIDATGSPTQRDMTVVIEGDRIAEVAPASAVTINGNAQVVDGRGKFLIPGLVDAHVHLTGSGEPTGSRRFIAPLLLANGITTVRDMGGYLESLKPLRDDIQRGKRLGPKIFFAGPYLDGSPPSFEPSLVVTNAAQAAEDVRTLVEQGVDFIKVQSILGREAYFAIAAAARREKIAFVGHVPDRVTAAEASDAGQKSIEHLTGVLRACASDEQRLMRVQMQSGSKRGTIAQAHAREIAWERELLRTYSARSAAALFEKFKRNQTWQTPTLVLLKTVAFPTGESDSLASDARARYVPRALLKKWQSAFVDREKTTEGGEGALNRELFKKSAQVVKQMREAGVHLLAGTDTGAPFLFPGFALHDELALLVQGALTPMEALQTATKSSAEFLGKSSAEGTIERGKVANLLLLDASPLDDISNTRKISVVIVRGRLLNRRALDDLLSSVEKFATAN